MQQRDIVVIGGSAGSLEPLRKILRELPPDFPAAILIVVHLLADSPALLDEQFSSTGALQATYPADHEEIRHRHVYLARPDYHLTVEAGRVRVLRGPRENRHRPAIDPLFRTAARVYGPRVIGIVLSGNQDDGSAGLYAVQQRGGVGIVQDPSEAAWQEMPRRALGYARPQYVVGTEDLGRHLVNLVMNSGKADVMADREQQASGGNGSQPSDEPEANLKARDSDDGEGEPSVFACPECHGVLWELKEGDMVRFRCRVGHSYGSESLRTEMSQASEAALWAAMRALEEKAAMQRRIADRLRADITTSQRLQEQSQADEANARMIRDMIFHRDAALEGGESESRKIA